MCVGPLREGACVSLHPYTHPASVRLIPEVSYTLCSPHSHFTHLQVEQQQPHNKVRVFSFSFQIRVFHFLLLDGTTTVKNILSLLILLTSPQSTPPLPLLLSLSKFRKQPKSESVFIACVTKYLCIGVCRQLIIKETLFSLSEKFNI